MALAQNKDVLACFLDVTAAFPSVKSDILKRKLASIGCPGRFLHFIHHLTYERLIFSQYTLEEPTKSYQGVIQGGAISPILYTLYVSDIVKNLPGRIKISQYADDIALYMTTDDAESDKNILVSAIKTLQQNLFNLGLELAPSKTKLIHFNKKKEAPGFPLYKC